MEKLKEEIKNNRNITESSLNIYSRNINRLAKEITGKDFSSISFLKEYKKIINWIDNKSLSTQKNYLASILVALSPTGRGKYKKGFDAVAKKYTTYLTTQSAEYDKNIKTQRKSKSQREKWVSMKELEKVRRKYASNIKRIGYGSKKITKLKDGKKRRHIELLQKYLVASLYILHPPRRNSYANMKVINSKEFNKLDDGEKDSNNYLVIVSRNHKFFSFGDHKARKSIGTQEIRVDKKLNSILNLYLNFHKGEYLLQNSRGGKMTTNGLSKFIVKTFEPTGKKISSTMLRHIYLTDKYGDESAYAEKEKDAKAMGHSVGTQQKTYVKKS
jgi:hypothetical protein